MTRLHSLVQLEALIIEQAKIHLELRNPQYVEAFQAALPGGLEAAMAAARPHLEEEWPWWYELLTSLLSVELTMDHVKHALSLMNTHRGADARSDGRLLRYHVDNWVIQTAALLEKADHLVCRVYRVLVSRVNPTGYGEKLRVARGHLLTLRQRYGSVRHPLVHPRGGSVRAIEEDRLWEAHVLIGATAAEVIDGYDDSLPAWRDRWYRQNTNRSHVLFSVIEAAFAQAVRDARGSNR